MEKKVQFQVSVAAALSCSLIGGCTNKANGPASNSSTADCAVAISAKPRFESEYISLKARIIAENNEVAAPSEWLMTDEHLFIGNDSLHDSVIRFARQEGGLDFLFDKVLDPKTTDQDLLISSEILVYFGGHPEAGDDKIISTRAEEVLKSLDAGRAANADKQFQSPVAQKIRDAAEKAIKNRSVQQGLQI